MENGKGSDVDEQRGNKRRSGDDNEESCTLDNSHQ